jgi:putative thiamine transport system permease protein
MRTSLSAAARLLPLLLLWAAPLFAAIVLGLWPALDWLAWAALLAHPQLPGAMFLSLWTGAASLVLSLFLALIIVTGLHGGRCWRFLAAAPGLFMAVPHLAFAIGFGFLIMPSGLVARLLVGGDAPPAWTTVQDPWGLALIAALVLKETPFLIAMLWIQLSQSPVAQSLAGQFRAARSLGHGPGSVWFRVLLPQLLARLTWPLVIVWAYGASVTDVALVIGPTEPPTLAPVIWADLNDAEAARNARGACGAVLLALAIATIAAAAWGAKALFTPLWRTRAVAGPLQLAVPRHTALALALMLGTVYALVIFLLLLLSLASLWPYPSLWPTSLSPAAWHNLSVAPLLTTLGLAATTAVTALAAVVSWFEEARPRADRLVLIAAIAAMALPALLTASGQYRLLLATGLTGSLMGLFLVHLAPVLAYVFIVLVGPYRGFDCRFRAVASGLNVGGARFWWSIKLPLLRAPLALALAIGFAVSMAQFVNAQLAAAGRYSTLPMEAVTLASGGNRPLTAAAALLLMLFPALAFLLAAHVGRPRWG